MALMVKKVQNLSSWLKKNYTFDYNLGPHVKIYSFYYNMSRVWSQSQKLRLKYNFDI
jgi:hypothetical protein